MRFHRFEKLKAIARVQALTNGANELDRFIPTDEDVQAARTEFGSDAWFEQRRRDEQQRRA